MRHPPKSKLTLDSEFDVLGRGCQGALDDKLVFLVAAPKYSQRYSFSRIGGGKYLKLIYLCPSLNSLPTSFINSLFRFFFLRFSVLLCSYFSDVLFTYYITLYIISLGNSNICLTILSSLLPLPFPSANSRLDDL